MYHLYEGSGGLIRGPDPPYILNRPPRYWTQMREAPNKIFRWTHNQTKNALRIFSYKPENLFVFSQSVCPRFSCENNVRNHFEGGSKDYLLHIVHYSHFSLFSYIYTHTQHNQPLEGERESGREGPPMRKMRNEKGGQFVDEMGHIPTKSLFSRWETYENRKEWDKWIFFT